ncbi:MAG: dihydrolipoyl dehydrogenase [Promethearchaeota archaeon]
MNSKIYDIIVIGGGPGGYHSAIRAAQYGATVALIEKDKVGGTCLNRGCIPTKALYSSAKIMEDIQEKSKEFGILLPEKPKVDFKTVVERKNKIINEMVAEIEQLIEKRKVDLFHGFGSISGGHINSGFLVKVDGVEQTQIKGKRIILATGSVPALIPNFNIDHERILTSDDILSPDFNIIPENLIVIGGGVIGCEFAYIFGQLGSKVTILEYLDTILATEEKLIVKDLKKKFKGMNIEIHESMNCQTIKNTGTGVEVYTIPASTPKEQAESVEKQCFKGDYCLVSIGRTKFTQNLGLENTRIKVERTGMIVNPTNLETDEPGIYAIGDVTGGIMLAHVATYEGEVAVHNALASLDDFTIEPMEPVYDVVPSTIFTNPEIGSVGIREKTAKELGYKTFIGRFAYGGLGKARCEGEDKGFMMVIADEASGEILGASCIGAEAPELIAEIALAMKNNLLVDDIIHTIHSHPTLSEMVLETCEDVYGLSIHKVRRPRIIPLVVESERRAPILVVVKPTEITIRNQD